MFFQQFPLLRLVLCLAAGITVSHFTGFFLSNAIVVIGLLLTILFVLNWRFSLRFNLFFGFLSLLLFIFLGSYRLQLSLATSDPDQLVNQELDEVEAYQAMLTAWPERREKSDKLEANVFSLYQEGHWVTAEGKVLLYTDTIIGDGLERGDLIWVGAAPERTQAPTNPSTFDYRRYLSFQNIHFQHFERNVHPVGHAPVSGLWRLSYRFRSQAESILRKYVKDDRSFGIALALVLGEKRELDATLSKAYAASGAMHILAVSGLHVGLIYWIFSIFYRQLPFRLRQYRWIEPVFSIILLLCYALLTGMSPSVMRAATMFSFVAVGKAIRRRSSIYNALAASALVLLLIDPQLLFSVGFQLSYLAVFGIVYLQPKLYQLLAFKHPIVDKLWAITCVSLAAQLATAPLSLYYFHQFPTYFLLTNLFAIPAAFLILFLGLLLLTASFLPAVASVIGLVLSTLIQLTNALVTGVGNLPLGQLNGIYLTRTETLLLYGLVACLVLFFSLRQFRMIYAALFLSMWFGVNRLANQLATFGQRELIVFDIPNEQAIHFRKGNRGHLVIDSTLMKDNDLMEFIVAPYQRVHGLDNQDDATSLSVPRYEFAAGQVLVFEGMKLLVLDKGVDLTQLPTEISWDLCISSTPDAFSIVEAKEFVLNSNATGAFLQETEDDQIHSIRESGFFMKTW